MNRRQRTRAHLARGITHSARAQRAHVRTVCTHVRAAAALVSVGSVLFAVGGRDQRRFVAYVMDEARLVEVTR